MKLDTRLCGVLLRNALATEPDSYHFSCCQVIFDRAANVLSSLLRWDSLFDSEAGSDVVFLVGPEQWRFPGHKAVLATTNPVFQAMLNGPMASQDTTITIEDVDCRAFDNLLR